MVARINDCIRALAVKSASPSRGANAVRLDKGEFPYPPSPKVIDAIAAAAGSVNRYPPMLGGDLRAQLAAYAGVAPEQIAIANGSDDLIELVLKTCLPPGGAVLLPTPTFFVYGFSARVLGGRVVEVPRSSIDFAVDTKALLARSIPQTHVLFLANPNNPTGNLMPRAAIVELLEHFDGWVVVDECYFEYCGETVVDLLSHYPQLIVLRSLSKSFGLAGLRVGYAIASAEVAGHLYRAAQIFPVNCLALAAASAALADCAYFEKTRKQILRDRAALARDLSALGLTAFPSAANYLFVSSESLGLRSDVLVSWLQQQQVWVADFGSKQGLAPYFWRAAIGLPDENRALLAGLSSIFTSASGFRSQT
ncbi:histidinol-phosphate aminotransferase [Rubidibacter lacunae KORDI 51-2]|uniref:Histidinol-phosphate aminotransferase n=1 Tax=Rubidibacter lacunae KORDI 51-2 TaxID=582515 RepID=U5DL67_9CHRO|nr:histidinol-phosphate transaminase [Rubidibacter lacunae]ERN41319.1 histidinol-phosphate aminotransferase [Rubidibacter lacunae KORDI 51-2]